MENVLKLNFFIAVHLYLAGPDIYTQECGRFILTVDCYILNSDLILYFMIFMLLLGFIYIFIKDSHQNISNNLAKFYGNIKMINVSVSQSPQIKYNGALYLCT